MPSYKAPIRDLQFVFHELHQADETLSSLPGFDEVSADLVDAILEEGAKVCEEVLQPINQSGDQEGCQFNEGVVTTPTGFKAAYQTYIEGGWPSLAADPELGGQGLPETISFMLEEMLCSANVSFSLYPGLTRGAINSINAHATDALKEQYLPKMVEGIWSGTMCLTEPHCGTDLGLVRTKAVPKGDGSYAISGTKIFITGGDQDLTENIIHLVLARLPDAPEGVRGISLFLVPKQMPDTNNEPGDSNGVTCGSIEHKMGIKASATCVMNFDDAIGYLVGPENKGLACMFTMMNAERLAIGMQGLGLGETAYQNAVEYAKDRLQSRSATGIKAPDKPADPLLVHPDIRRMLLTTRAYNEGCRALAVWTAMNIDLSHKHPDAKKREEADDYVALITPIIKAFFSDYGYETTTLCQQVLGGHGYIQEWGMEQYVRDARIAQIYEGTNGIQALDLIRRKLFIHEGRLPQRFFNLLNSFVNEHQNSEAMNDFVSPLADALKLLEELTDWLVEQGKHNPDELGAAATDYLRIFALTTLAWLWADMARVALEKAPSDDTGFYITKLRTARFFMGRLLPQIYGLGRGIRSGADLMMEFTDDEF
ncbi:acyl-CoA dehydrogenase C-terminal domain-containing protein [Sedimenticola selenatireducens]|uniref:3-methylmercaptopropionyl-CoA dehydrogenase n=1 Tax=Sedimenticola selenatireducens TaxID=191960 RepID=A0A557SMY2_9GAMM|nr:acyl-CoA dehydrogenase C-terminal domain-containing protein [Sedimenticola selenatireducens]TVO78766.1 acyl-CoA dehydrogenase [Sedimenticola selenatireducens]TVT62128.1 MAG: acyl-CoA dehydrogenase [Sedimenticola selenatireducens]